MEYLRSRLASFRYAFSGLADMFKTQPNARIHFAAALTVAAAGVFFRISAAEWAIMSVCIAVVMAFEAVNTAIEYLTDLVSPGYHPLAGKAKDAAAAAVLLAAMGAVGAGGAIFGPRIATLIATIF